MRYYCTYFDHRYMPRGLALLGSLQKHARPFRLFVLCLDDACYDALVRADLPEVTPIALPALELGDPALSAARSRRSLVEFYFTLTPILPLHILNAHPEVDLITYLDSDLYFFANPQPLFDELAGGAIAIIGHRFSEAGKFRERYGVFNVGWVSWRRDARGLACLNWYRERCLEWCFDNADDGERFADQKYLDEWPVRFAGTRVIEHNGCNLAPWNLENYSYAQDASDALTINGQPIIFYHFHGLKDAYEIQYDKTSIEPYLTAPRTFDENLILDTLYRPYSKAMHEARAQADAMNIDKEGAGEELRHTSTPPSALSAKPWREALDWTAPECGVPHDAWSPSFDNAVCEPPRDAKDSLLARAPDLIRELAVAQARALNGGEAQIIEENIFECRTWQDELSRISREGAPIVLNGVRTFSATESKAVLRRKLGEYEAHPIWVVNRNALEAALKTQGYDIVREFVWPESERIAPLAERADRRTIVAAVRKPGAHS